MIMWYSKKGRPLTDYGLVEKLLTNLKYKIIKKTSIFGRYTVSSVWLGLNHDYLSKGETSKDPVIFETMVFKEKPFLKDIFKKSQWYLFKINHFSEGLEQYRFRLSNKDEQLKMHEHLEGKYGWRVASQIASFYLILVFVSLPFMWLGGTRTIAYIIYLISTILFWYYFHKSNKIFNKYIKSWPFNE